MPVRQKSDPTSATSVTKNSDFHVQSKYYIGLTSQAKKCDKMRKAKTATFNRTFVKQNKGFFGFIPLSKLPTKIKDISIPSDLNQLEIHNKLAVDGRHNFCDLQIPLN